MHIPTKEERKKKKEEAKRKREEKKALQKEAKASRPRIKSGNIRYVFRAIFIIVMLFFVVLGVYFATHVENATSVKRKMDAYRVEINEIAGEQKRVEAFANTYVATYYTNSPEDSEANRQKEIEKYTKNTSEENSVNYATEVVSSNVVSSEKIGKDGYEVKVRFSINIYLPIEGSETDETYVKNEAFTVQIPISIKNGDMTVRANPTYVSDPNTPSEEDIEIAGDEAGENDAGEAEILAKSFLKEYCEGNRGSIKNFVTDNFDARPLGSAVKFKEISTCEVVDKGKYLMAKVDYVVISDVGEETQTMVLNIVKSNKYLVDSIGSVWWR